LLLVLWAAGAVSVVCNVLAAEPSLVSRFVASWPPIALLLAVDVVAKGGLPSGRIRWAIVIGLAATIAPAALASYHHMHQVALDAGESPLVAALFPLSVDGLAVVASVALFGTDPKPPAPGPEPDVEPAPTATPVSAPVDETGPVSLFVPSQLRATYSAPNGTGSTTNPNHQGDN